MSLIPAGSRGATARPPELSGVVAVRAHAPAGRRPGLASDGAAPARAADLTGSVEDASAGQERVARLLDANGDLCPPPPGGRSGDLAVDRVVAALTAASLAENTRRSYGGHVRAFAAWCAERGFCPLPATERTVIEHLAWFAVQFDDFGREVRSPSAALVPAVAVVTVDIRLAAINKAHDLAHLPLPGRFPEVKKLVAGMHRTFPRRPTRAKAALDLAGLQAVIAAAQLSHGDRDVAAIVLRAGTGASAEQLAALDWEDVDITADRVRVHLPAGNGPARHVDLPADPGSPACPVTAVTAWRTAGTGTGAVLTRHGTQRLTRAGVADLVRRSASDPEAWRRLTRMKATGLAHVIAQVRAGHEAVVLRDTALLCCGWFTAQRRATLAALAWGDIDDHQDDGVCLLVRRSKTDQEGFGRTLWLPTGAPGAAICPAGVLRTWRGYVHAALGVDPVSAYPHAPVFARLDRGGQLHRTGPAKAPAGMSAASVNAVLQRLVVRAGLPGTDQRVNPFGAHSLRAGFVTEALRDDKLSIAEVAEVTGHVSMEVLLRYRREVNAAQQNPAAKLLGATLTAPATRPA